MAAGKVNILYLSDIAWHLACETDFVIPANSVQVWRINISASLGLLKDLSALLDPQEKLRSNKYHHQRDHNRFIISRGAQRIILGRYLNTHPARFNFVFGDNKKPRLTTGNPKNLQYNVSHSGDWILLTVSEQTVGCDIEHINPLFNYTHILPEYFNDNEAAYIGGDNGIEKFYTLWTRKEALLKATGQGLGDHLIITPALIGEYDMHPSLTGNALNWQVNSFQLNNYAASVASSGAAAHLQFLDIELRANLV